MGGIPHTACPPRNSGMATPTISEHALGSCGEVCHQEKGTEKAPMSCFTPLSCKDGMKKTYALLETASGRSSLSIRATSRRIQKALQNYWDMPALGTCPLKCSLLEHAHLSYLDRHALVTCLLKLLGRARSCDMPFNILGTSPLWRHSKFLGQDRSWYMPFNILETSRLWRHALHFSLCLTRATVPNRLWISFH